MVEIHSSKTYYAFRGSNFITPFLVGYYESGGYQVELSENRVGRLYGVTVAKKGERCRRLDGVFEYLSEALQHIESLGTL